MLKSCIYKGRTPMDIPMCLRCCMFLETCVPIADSEGYSNGECAAYLCESCSQNCYFSLCVNL